MIYMKKYRVFRAAIIFLVCAAPVSTCPHGCECNHQTTHYKCRLPATRSLPGSEFPTNTTKLDLAGNNILNVPPGSLTGLPHIEELILDGNKIYFIEDGAFKGVSRLKNLSLENNNIHFIEANAFTSLDNLEELNLKKNQLRKFPVVGRNFALLKLSLCYNRIDKLPPEALKGNTRLKDLRIYSNELREIPRALFPDDVSTYRTLDLGNNRLRDIPDVVQEMTGLESLVLSHNPIKVLIARELGLLRSLRRLFVEDIGLNDIPENFLLLPKLEQLDLSNNKISGGSLLRLRLPELKTLDISGNPIRTLQRLAFTSVPNLETLSARSCEISGADFQAFNSLRRLKKLDLHDNRLVAIPRLQINADIEELDLSQNKIVGIGQNRFSDLPRLKSLSLANNSLSSLPAIAFSDTSAMLDLDLSGNKLAGVPVVFSASMNNLKTLDLSSNRLLDIPKNAFDGVTKLETLNLINNHFRVIQGDKLSQLRHLKSLYLCNNNLTSLADGMLSNLPALTEFTANNNEIREISNSTFEGNLYLKRISLKNNAIHHIEEGSFSTLKELSELFLIQNKLMRTPNLSSNQHLKTIGLCNNPLGNLSDGALAGPNSLEVVLLRSLGMSELNQISFGNTRNIRYLHLAFDNYLTRIPTVVRNMTALRVLKLTGNPIQFVTARDFAGLNNLRELRLDKMHISSMDVTELFPALPGIRTLYLSENPWKCDCEMQWYILGVDGARGRVTTEDKDDLKCAGPGRLAGKSFGFLRLGDFRHCTESRITTITDTTALISLPVISNMRNDRVEMFNKIYYAPLRGGKENVLMIESQHREVRLSQLTPNVAYLVCVTTVTSTPRVVDSSSEPTSGRMAISVIHNGDGHSPRESCHRFTTLPSSVRTPWNQSDEESAVLDPQYLVLVYAALGGALGVVLITALIAYVVWCKRMRLELSDSTTGFADITNKTSNENQELGDETELGAVDSVDFEGADKDVKAGKRRKQKHHKQKKKKEPIVSDGGPKDANGGVVEMSSDVNAGQINEACRVIADGHSDLDKLTFSNGLRPPGIRPDSSPPLYLPNGIETNGIVT